MVPTDGSFQNPQLWDDESPGSRLFFIVVNVGRDDNRIQSAIVWWELYFNVMQVTWVQLLVADILL